MAIGTAAAIIGSAAIGAGASIAASNASKSAAKKQAQAIQQGSDAQVQLAREQMARATALFSPYLQDEQMAKAYVDALYLGSGSYTAGNQTVTVTRDQVEALIESTPLAQYAEELYQGAQDLADATRAGSDALSGEELAGMRGQYDQNYADLIDRYGDARTGRRTLADEQLAQRLALEEDSYAQWRQQRDLAEQKAQDLNFSKLGVTGLVGQTKRSVGETAMEAEMERNLMRLQGVQRAYDPFFDAYEGAELDYWQDALNADRSRADLYNYAQGNYYDQRRGAYDRQRAQYDENYNRRASDQLSNYADFVNRWGQRENRGYNARGNIASAGQNFTDTAANAVGNAAQAQAERYAAYGQADANMYGQIARTAGNAWDSYSNQKSYQMPAYTQPYVQPISTPSYGPLITPRQLPRYGG